MGELIKTTNVALGINAGKTNQGFAALALGMNAAPRDQGANSISIGYNSNANGQPRDSIALGVNVNNTASSQICVGHADWTVKIGDGNIQSISDRRDKRDIDYKGVHGLDFIMKLKTCTYRYDVRELYWEYNDDGSITKHPRDGRKAGKRHHPGLIAQDVKAVADELGFDFSGYRDEVFAATEHHKDNEDKKALVYTSFIPSLIKAIQEQQSQIEELKKQLPGQ